MAKGKKPGVELTGAQEYEAVAAASESRWFRVTGERFDWIFSKSKMKSFKHGQIAYEPRACVDAGVAAGLVERIERPANARVDKSGRVVFT